MQDYKKLQAWQKAHSLVLQTYAISATFPRAELFGLTSQMRRAAISVAANIAEGCCRGGNRMLAQSLRVSLGSAGELEYYLVLATDLKFIPKAQIARFTKDAEETKRVITGLLKVVNEARLTTEN
jgi:four helix bundle protein